MTSRQIEIGLLRQYPERRWFVVPRVAWGMRFDEIDFLALSQKGYAHAIEIKISISDLKREFKKHAYFYEEWSRNQNRGVITRKEAWIKHEWFALPMSLMAKAEPLIPERFGIYGIDDEAGKYGRCVTIIRMAPRNKGALPWPMSMRYNLARNLTLKYWSSIRKQEREKILQGVRSC